METERRPSERTWRAILYTLGAVYLAQAVWATVHPTSFAGTIANFGAYNEHLVHDYAACAGTFALGLLVAARMPSWRPAALTLTALWNGFHAISHIVDAGDLPVVGPIEAVLLVVITGVFAVLARLSMRRA